MTAIACLKIFVGEELVFADTDTMASVVAKVASAYLETHWTWPRRYGLVAPFSFVLADPRATSLDAEELCRMSRDLQYKLFGENGAGEVTLLMLEGDQAEVMRFAGTPALALKTLLDGLGDGAFAGRVCKITPEGAVSLAPPDGPTEGAPPAEELAALSPAPGDIDDLLQVETPRTGWWGIYYLPKERFVGGGVGWGAEINGGPVTDLVEAVERDQVCHEAALVEAKSGPSGYLFLPFCFSALIKPSLQRTYDTTLQKLPRALRPRLAANIYDVPREPSYGAINKVRSLLIDRFSLLDLHVSDPGFRIESLQAGAVNSVTLVLSGEDERQRAAAITRFLRDPAIYRNKRVWQGIAGVQSLRELDLCRRLKAPFLSGPIVAPISAKFPGEPACPSLNLPYRHAV
ncbi:hypothetical protein [Caulobacter sp. BK020]|uniref:hypothetical protein n=1 Tax=Caulobacter sp. BK020 TaxID=2512117 RepID=UPI0010496C40|nr:hypothetical protein [Caulobacter sp. BK020]TCS15876.1 hypothetical protein EV278_10448 [Caulobacter sp. BK020]